MNGKAYLAAVLAAAGMLAFATPGEAAQTCAQMMHTVRQELDTAHYGVLKDDAKMQISIAEKAMANKNEEACITALDQARSDINQSLAVNKH